MNKNCQRGFSAVIIIIFVAVLVVIGGAGVFITKNRSRDIKSSTTETAIQQFVTKDFIDLSKIYSISKFRSGEGHDFSGNGETCRSMKHYFTPQIDVNLKPTKAEDGRTIPPQPDGKTDIDIFSPVDGTITDIVAERFPVGEQIYIVPSVAKDYTIRLFHIYKIDGVNKGTVVKAGQKIGVISKDSATDISVEVGRNQYVSYFQVMSDSLFASYQERGLKTRDDLIIAKAYRDANPIPCNQDSKSDQAFHYPENYDHDADSVYLSGYLKPDYSKAQEGQHNLN